MKLYNVYVGVVDIVEAENKAAAIDRLRRDLTRQGFSVHIDDATRPADAFESETD